ncbi:MAG: hypothetical protein M1837_001856 [Sclerophora amabilis]|nr:MAG: hypothetical protein M1837_001856 [Sclerophora amabilis]
MAGIESKAPVAIGSSPWISNERGLALQFIEQDMEDFTFSARNEMEWLNEHMADVFHNNQINLTEMLKTPGKLRGKTPRTIKKRNGLDGRAPLTDIFTANHQAAPLSTHASGSRKPAVGFKLAEDRIGLEGSPRLGKPPAAGKENTDSGYHDMTEDEMYIDCLQQARQSPTQELILRSTEETAASGEPSNVERMDIDGESNGEPTEGALQFTTHLKDAAKNTSNEDSTDSRVPDSAPTSGSDEIMRKGPNRPVLGSPANEVSHHSPENVQTGQLSDDALSQEIDARSPSDASSPVQPLLRKSSLNFASLPAREPLTTKKSIGARISRTSNLDQARLNGQNRGSYFGRQTGGKSIGGHRRGESDHSEHSDREDEEHDSCEAPDEESDEESRTTKLHHKTSTQRLQGRINMLAQSQPPRPNKSIAPNNLGNSQLKYPDLPGTVTDHQTIPIGKLEGSMPDDDEDDWIPSKPGQLTASKNRPQLLKSHSADVMEQINGKESIGTMDVELRMTKSNTRSASPLKSPAREHQADVVRGHFKSASTSIIASPQISPAAPKPGFSKHISVSNPSLATTSDERFNQSPISSTPVGSPASKKYADGPLSASKAKLSSLLKSARGIFANSAGVSAQAKMETLSPSSLRLRNQAGAPLMNRNDTLLPSIDRPLPDPPKTREPPHSPSKDDGRRTRSSTEKDGKKKEKESQERQKLDQELEKVRQKERQKAAAYKLEKAKGKENFVAEEYRHQEQQGQKQLSGASDQIQSSQVGPRRIKAGENDPAQGSGPNSRAGTTEEMQQSTTNPMSSQSQQPTQPQKLREPRRPMKPSKENVPKTKPAPVAIRVDTVSQWGLDHRKIAQGSTNAAGPAQALQSTAPQSAPATKQFSLQKKASNSSLQSSSTANGSKFSTSTATGRPKALLAAERKKEQDEREAQRKLEHKREMERKRAAQQEEERRQEQQHRKDAERQRAEERAAAAEEQKKAAQRQALEKRRLEMARKVEQQKSQQAAARIQPVNEIGPTIQQDKSQAGQASHRGELGNAKAPTRINPAANVRVVQEDFNRSVKQPQLNPAKPPKRGLQNDALDEQSIRQVNKGGPAVQQSNGKRRKTDEVDLEIVEARQAMPPPPIRRSNMNGGPSKPNFPSGYTAVSHAANNHVGPSLFNPASGAPSGPQHIKPTHPMAMATVSTDKIPFADNQGNKSVPLPPSHKTPTNKGPALVAKSSPRYPNGDGIELPEIATDSEDEDEENDFVVPDWARSPNLDPSLLGQQLWNPEEVFGPPNPTLHVEEIFVSKDRHHRFRARTSSANWNGQDRLTQDEIERDLEARERLIANGGWTYGL